MDTILEQAKRYMRSHPNRKQLAAEAGVSEEWIKKVLAGEREDPRISFVQRILDHQARLSRIQAA